MHSNLMHLKFFNAKYNLVGMKNIARSLAKTSNYDCIVG